MKAVVLLLACCVSAYAQTFIPNCSEKEVEMAIVWPYYEDIRFYYECIGIGQRELSECTGDLVFSYPYQQCTEERLYIPPPAPENLPTEFPPNATTPIPTTTPEESASTTTTEESPITTTTEESPITTTPEESPITTTTEESSIPTTTEESAITTTTEESVETSPETDSSTTISASASTEE